MDEWKSRLDSPNYFQTVSTLRWASGVWKNLMLSANNLYQKCSYAETGPSSLACEHMLNVYDHGLGTMELVKVLKFVGCGNILSSYS